MFNYNGNVHYLKEAVAHANILVRTNEEFYEIISRATFDMATITGEEIVSVLKDSLYDYNFYDDSKYPNFDLDVIVYRPFWRWSKALGYFNKSQPNKIFLNEFRLNRSLGSLVATLVHEWVHYCDLRDEEHYFGHGDNNSKGKQNTAPYFIGNLASELVDYESNYNNNENSSIKTVKNYPIYRRVFNFFKRIFK